MREMYELDNGPFMLRAKKEAQLIVKNEVKLSNQTFFHRILQHWDASKLIAH